MVPTDENGANVSFHAAQHQLCTSPNELFSSEEMNKIIMDCVRASPRLMWLEFELFVQQKVALSKPTDQIELQTCLESSECLSFCRNYQK